MLAPSRKALTILIVRSEWGEVASILARGELKIVGLESSGFENARGFAGWLEMW